MGNAKKTLRKCDGKASRALKGAGRSPGDLPLVSVFEDSGK